MPRGSQPTARIIFVPAGANSARLVAARRIPDVSRGSERISDYGAANKISHARLCLAWDICV